jgi:predicted regulator of Ras-like GTPase activity (Roadblock/LC7/MglB family)
VDAEAALAELMELSAQVETAAVLGSDGSVVAATVPPERAAALAAAAGRLAGAARAVRSDGPQVARVEVRLPEGSAFLVNEGELSIVATTVPEPRAGLVVYDLRTCLRRIAEGDGTDA